MNPNLTPQSFTHKDLLLKKLYYSVICSVLSQLVLLQLYVFVSTFNLFHPIQWILESTTTFTSFRTWLFTVPFLGIIFAQSVICAKDYVFKSTYCSTRFQKLISAFSLHNLVLLFLHILAGPALIWLFLSLGGGQFQNLTTSMADNQVYVLNEGSFFLVLSGLWTGFFYFIKVYMAEKHLAFPVIHQRKWLQFKTQVFPLLKSSFSLSIWPTATFIIFYMLWGSTFSDGFSSSFGLDKVDKMSGIFVYLNLWCFTGIYYFNMHLMKFFFNLFLTEHIEFPLCKLSETSFNLQDSLSMSDLPIIQNLACLDLYNLAQWSKERRQVFYTLSQPGGHPYNWNALVENVLKLFNEYIVLLNKSTESMDSKPAVVPPTPPMVITPVQSPNMCRSPMLSPDKFRNLRNMSVISDPCLADVLSVTQQSGPKFELPEAVVAVINKKINSFITIARVVLGIDFVFGELPQANIQKCLANGLIIIWTSQGISELTCAAMTEDRYGIVQKDIPALVSTLVDLKQNLDKLSKISALTKKIAGQDDFNYKMKVAVISAVQRSLFKICLTYKEYLNELPLSKGVKIYLQGIKS
ncbi:nucleoporin Ndc1 [Diabrotica virgifera virgifera]|uniref:Nucleoporin Ndc1 n=1 Tax=Diabrotica virgifera virgifera TaxID=50390 RepID=A0A6P7G5N3_DIAVI|nr:nucleoporin Ndc1 [Diabrotica virgifera virgifera]